MFWVDVSAEWSPSEDSEWLLCDARVDSLAILSRPDDECVVLADAGEETVIWGESKFVNALLNTLQNDEWLPCLVAPENNWGIWCSLEDGTSLSSGDQLT